MSNNNNFLTFLNFILIKEANNKTQNLKDNKEATKKLRTLILSTNVNDYDTGE
jgi:hypothetical protein